jgi:hypothetical protein
LAAEDAQGALLDRAVNSTGATRTQKHHAGELLAGKKFPSLPRSGATSFAGGCVPVPEWNGPGGAHRGQLAPACVRDGR